MKKMYQKRWNWALESVEEVELISDGDVIPAGKSMTRDDLTQVWLLFGELRYSDRTPTTG